VPRLAEFFSDSQVIKDQDKADLITCNNAFAHNADLTPILRGVKALLADKGTFVFEVAYALPMLKGGLFDLIYHEHVHHWSLSAAIPFLREHGLEVYDAEEVPTHGGSLRVYARHAGKPGNKPTQKNLMTILRAEALDLDDAVRRFPVIVDEERSAARHAIRSMPGTLGLLGYPAKACTLLGYWGIGNDIQHVFDDNEHKIGKRSHFGHVIAPASTVATVKPDRLLVTSWNYADELKRRFPMESLLIPHPFRAA
jgi:SAM-dependent methyltransferase